MGNELVCLGWQSYLQGKDANDSVFVGLINYQFEINDGGKEPLSIFGSFSRGGKERLRSLVTVCAIH